MSNKFEQFVNQGFFLSCGGQKLADPNFKVFLNAKSGMYEPVIGKYNDDYLHLCAEYKINYNDLSKKLFGIYPNTDLGQTESTYLGQSTDYSRNYSATSGAIIKETLRTLFSSGKIDAAIVLKKAGPLDYKPCKITSIEDVDSLPPSVYHALDYSDTIKILKEAKELNIVIVGVPWQIDGLYQYIFSEEPELRKKIYLTIGLLTGWYFTHHTIRALCSYYRINYDDLDDIVYRGGGKSGKTKFIFKDGSSKIINRFTIRSLVAFERFFNVPKFLVEVNTQNMLADLVVGDAHIPECAFSRAGISLIIPRSKRANDLLLEMENNNIVRLQKVDNETLVRSQKRGRLYGDFAWSYMEYLRTVGYVVPEIESPSKDKAITVEKRLLEKFHKDLLHKRSLQFQGRYWQILIEKYTIDGLSIYPKLFRQVFDKFLYKSKLKRRTSLSSLVIDSSFV